MHLVVTMSENWHNNKKAFSVLLLDGISLELLSLPEWFKVSIFWGISYSITDDDHVENLSERQLITFFCSSSFVVKPIFRTFKNYLLSLIWFDEKKGEGWWSWSGEVRRLWTWCEIRQLSFHLCDCYADIVGFVDSKRKRLYKNTHWIFNNLETKFHKGNCNFDKSQWSSYLHLNSFLPYYRIQL